jgi:hypothetical protein
MARVWGQDWYQLIGLVFVYIYANFINYFFKEPRPFKFQKLFTAALEFYKVRA